MTGSNHQQDRQTAGKQCVQRDTGINKQMADCMRLLLA